MKEYFNYWDVTSAALNAINPKLVFGGPGDNLLHSHNKSYSWQLLDHITNGINYWTKKKEGRIDFIATHSKGTTSINGKRVARTTTILNSEKTVIGVKLYYNCGSKNCKCTIIVACILLAHVKIFLFYSQLLSMRA